MIVHMTMSIMVMMITMADDVAMGDAASSFLL